VFDLTAAILLLCCASLIIVFAMCIIRLKIGSPVFFTQVRPGLNGKPFTLYKFRTMTDERDKEGNLLPDEVRLTKTGKLIRKLSIDELPQLWNVIKGDLSLVGPRPLLMEYLPLYTNKQSRRHEVKPGITGWAQVNGRNAISWEKKFELDVWYVDHRSFFLDLKILFLTVRKVLISEGIHQSDHATSERFRGSGDVSL
jgi:sugar transferase EpsL